jgi:hypothetical protein
MPRGVRAVTARGGRRPRTSAPLADGSAR